MEMELRVSCGGGRGNENCCIILSDPHNNFISKVEPFKWRKFWRKQILGAVVVFLPVHINPFCSTKKVRMKWMLMMMMSYRETAEHLQRHSHGMIQRVGGESRKRREHQC